MTATVLIRDLRSLGVTVALVAGELVLDGPADVLSDDLLGHVRAHKLGIVAALQALSGNAPLHQQWSAALDTLPATPDPCPGLMRGEWRRVQELGLAFLRDHSQEAARLGWSAAELFGVHPVAGAARLDCCGALIVALAPVASVTADAIRYINGLTYRRQAVSGSSIPVWELANSDLGQS